MKVSWTGNAVIVCALLIATGAHGESSTSQAQSDFLWFAFPDSAKFKVLGLYWFDQNTPKLWRMPAKNMDSLPDSVQRRAKCASGGRILLRCTTTTLAVRAAVTARGKFDVYINGQLCLPTVAKTTGNDAEFVLFEGMNNQEKEIVIYLPHLCEVVVQAIGVDPQTKFSAPVHQFACSLPIVFYGSSVCQGSGAIHSAQTYEAILCRELNVDFINLGFGAAGKAEADVVGLVNSIPACCYVFDLGKSYGMQDATAFKVMLQTIRSGHPNIPMIAITPITSAREVKEPSYAERSIHTRNVMREPVKELIRCGDMQLFLVEGEDLLGFNEHTALSKDGVHPSEKGYQKIAAKLLPLCKQSIRFELSR